MTTESSITTTPDPHEARIAELRQRRRARLRWLAIRGGMASAMLAVLLLGLLYWLLQTVAGRDMLLAQVIARLPANASFTWSKAEGPLAGPLTLHDVDLHWDKIHFSAERILLDPDLRPLLGKRLRLDALEIRNAQLDMPPSDEPFELPSWPESLPAIEMPLAIQADTLKIDGFRVLEAGEPIIHLHQLRGGMDIGNGYLHAEKLQVRSDRGDFRIHGGYTPANDYSTDMVVSAIFPAPAGRAPAALGLVARGDVDQMVLALSGRAPAPIQLSLTVQGREAPTWHFKGNTKQLDLAALALTQDSLPLAFDLKADGANNTATLQGRVQQADLDVVIAPSKLSLKDKVLNVDPLSLQLLDGIAQLRGSADFSVTENPVFTFAVNARGLRWGEDAETTISADADLGVAGQLKNWAAKGKAKLVRAEQTAHVELDARGDNVQAHLNSLKARMPTGTLDASGDIGWEPVLKWNLLAKLAGFDPGYFVAGWDGNVSGQLASKGQARDSSGYDASLDIPRLQGRLRGRPLDAQGNFVLHGNQGEGKLALSLGGSRVRAQGKLGDTLAVDASLQPLQLADLLPDASGSLSGTLKLTGTRTAPNIDANLSGSALSWDGYTAESIQLQGRLPWRNGNGELNLRGTTVNAGIALDRIDIIARGAMENLQLQGEASNPMIAASFSANAAKRGQQWQGTLESLRLAPSKGDAWRLQQAAHFSQGGAIFTLSPACLSTSMGSPLCLSANWPREGVSVHADALPLSLVQPWLPPREGQPLNLRGDVSVDAQLRPQGKAWVGQIHLASLDGALQVGTNARGEIIRYDNFTFDVELNPQRIQGRLGTGFKGNGYVDATFATGWDEFSPLKGDLYFNNSRLFWLELFSPDLVRPRGVIAGHIGLAGTRGQPALSGEADLTDFTGDLPALGITLSQGNVRLIALADGSASIIGSVKAGEGLLNVDGTLGWNNDTTPLTFHVSGDKLLVSDTSQLRAVASPDIQVSLVDKTIQVRGKVVVPSAMIDIERLSEGVSTSADVVILDPENPDSTADSPIDLDLTMELGDDVALKGYGLEGTLTGALQVRSRQGQDMIAHGRLDVDGRYTAYGQKLTITRGELTWSNNPVSDPRINIRAQREVVSAGVTAGIDVTGRANRPKARVWSDPETTESEALAYLVLGRSLSTASSDESQQINAASSALSAGAGLLASQLGAKIGLDDAGVLESRTLGGSVFGVGKYLSPKLYVSYGVSTVGLGSAVTLKYLLRKGFDIEIESSTVETRGSLNWRKEK